LASDLDAKKLDAMTAEISLAQTIQKAPEILAGKVRGRLVVNVNA
jgi:acrylyl-CoA reductase (NADPH)